MNTAGIQPRASRLGLPEVPTGIQGPGEITEDGLPAGRLTLVRGGAGAVRLLVFFYAIPYLQVEWMGN